MSNKFQARISNDRNLFVWNLGFSSLGFVWDLACLREAASAKAGACDLEFPREQQNDSCNLFWRSGPMAWAWSGKGQINDLLEVFHQNQVHLPLDIVRNITEIFLILFGKDHRLHSRPSSREDFFLDPADRKDPAA